MTADTKSAENAESGSGDSAKAARKNAPLVPKKPPTVKRTLEAFLVEVDALADTLPLVLPLVTESNNVASREFGEFLKRRGQKSEDGKIFTIPADEFADYENLRRRRQRNARALEIIPRSFLTSLISHNDAFIGSLLRAVFYMKPEILNSSEHHLSFKELVSFESIGAALEYVADKEVDSLLRESHADQFKWMESKFGTPLTKNLPSWPSFIEVTERRNLFVHCNGIVSPQYLAICSRHGCDISKVIVGQELHVSPAYFKSAYATIVEIGLKLPHVLWRRLKPDEMEEADTSLNNLCLDLIRDEKFNVAINLLDFAVQFKEFGSESTRRILTLNRAQAYKWGGQDDRAKEILNAEDWDASNEKLQLGAAVLKEDFAGAARLMKHIGATGPLSKGDYKEWPMFKMFRASPEFADAYKEVFGQQFGEVTVGDISGKKESSGSVQ